LTLQLVLGTWTIAFGGAYLATRKKEDKKKLNEGPVIQSSTSDLEEAKFIEYLYLCGWADLVGIFLRKRRKR